MNWPWIAVTAVLLTAPTISFCQEIDWQTDLDSAKTMAAKQNKLVLMHFSADWCRPCKNLETFVFTSPKVINVVDERVVAVRVDTDLHPELVKQYNVTEIPTDVVITPAGRIVQKRQSPKDTSNYVHMLTSLDSIVKALSEDNAAVVQKIDEILDRGKSKELPSRESNDFVAKQESIQHPGPSYDSNQLKENMSSHAKLVDHVTSAESSEFQVDVDQTDAKVKAREPERVINDRFFNEKSNAVDDRPKNVESSENMFQTAETSNPAQSQTGTTARILTADMESSSKSATKVEQFDKPGSNGDCSSSGCAVVNCEKSKCTNEGESPGVSLQNDTQFGLDGKCPVTLITDGKWADGDPRFGCVHRGKTYLFADQARRDKFQQDPESFSPLLAGFDPVLFHEKGELVEGLEEHGVFMGKEPNQRIVLFQSPQTRAQFQQNPRQYMTTIRQAIEETDTDTLR